MSPPSSSDNRSCSLCPVPSARFPLPGSLLLVDDAPEIAWIVQRFARQAGQTVVTFGDAESAWEHLRREPLADLAIFDVNLPGASGADLCRQLRAEPRLAALRVALFSHWDRPRDIAAGLDAGADYVLSKELILEPDAWQARLAEILPPAPGRPPALSLPWEKTHPPERFALVPRINRALEQVARAPLGVEMVRLLGRRAASVTEPTLDSWLRADGLGLNPERGDAAPAVLLSFVIACAAEIWRLLGTAGSQRFWAALEDFPSPNSENTPHS